LIFLYIKIVYERLINFCDDPGSKDALQFLMTREITHMKAFTAALESMGKNPFSVGEIPPTPVLVDQYFNDSTGVGDEGETDARGPWNEGGDWEIVEAPQLEHGVENFDGSASGEEAGAKRKTSSKEDAKSRKRAS
jgi:Mn-containing catalase